MRSICVFCGSSGQVRPEFLTLGRRVGSLLAARSIRLVYGGASVGVMGAVADAVIAAGSPLTGVITEPLSSREIVHRGIEDLRVVDSLSARKKVMADESDGFLVLPGGLGTMDEFFEMVTWRQLDLLCKPIGLLNADHYYDALIDWIRGAVAERFAPSQVCEAIEVLPDLAAVAAWLDKVLVPAATP